LHSRKTVFLDGTEYGSADPREEHEANDWATNFLIPPHAMQRFVAGFQGTEDEVLRFSGKEDVAPGIVVGQLQKRGVLKFSQMNKLKEHFKWADE
jgi:HTH-type transcriptional regulator/antitoxin HigA